MKPRLLLVLAAACGSKAADAPAPAPAPPANHVAAAPAILPPALPFELPPPKEPIVALGGSCVVRASGHVDCWDTGTVTRVPGIDDAIAVLTDPDQQRCLVRRTAITCTPLGYNDAGASFGALVNPTAVVLGYHPCALSKSGTVTCADLLTKAITQVPNLDAIALAAGKYIVCAVERSGHVSCSAENGWHRIPKLEHVKLLGIGSGIEPSGPWSATACAVHDSGAFECFELSGIGGGPIKLGPITDETYTIPRRTWDQFRGATALVTAEELAAAIVDGHVVAYDRQRVHTLTHLTDAVAISEQCALRAQGSVVCWGDNTWHALGQPIRDEATAPAPVVGVADVVSFEVESSNAFAVRADGALFEWGNGVGGWAVPHEPPPLPLTSTVHRSDSWCGIRRDRGVTCQVGRQTVDVKIHDVTTLERTSGGYVAVRADGTAARWSSTMSRAEIEPEPILELTGVTRFSGDGELACFLDRGGKVRCSTLDCWTGGTTFESCAARKVPVLDHAVDLLVSGGTACARVASGAVMCWGGNVHGELGRPPAYTDLVPKPVALAQGAVALSAGVAAFCAALPDGSLVCWGGLENDKPPHQALPKASVTARIAGYEDFGCTLGLDRLLRCWGRNDVGRLGDGSVIWLDEPAAVPGL